MVKIAKALITAYLFLLIYMPELNAELIEPSRTSQGTANALGNLTILSEPPNLNVTLDNTRIGKTPVYLNQVKPGIHQLRIEDLETEIYLEPGGNLKISLFNGKFIKIPVEEQQPVKQQAPKERQTDQTSTIQQPPPKEQNKDLTP